MHSLVMFFAFVLIWQKLKMINYQIFVQKLILSSNFWSKFISRVPDPISSRSGLVAVSLEITSWT
jgi:hypothetical protein